MTLLKWLTTFRSGCGRVTSPQPRLGGLGPSWALWGDVFAPRWAPRSLSTRRVGKQRWEMAATFSPRPAWSPPHGAAWGAPWVSPCLPTQLGRRVFACLVPAARGAAGSEILIRGDNKREVTPHRSNLPGERRCGVLRAAWRADPEYRNT